MSSSLDSLGLSTAVVQAFVCKDWFDSWGRGVVCVYYIVDMQWCSRLKGIISVDLDMRHGDSARTCRFTFQRHAALTWAYSTAIQPWNATRTSSLKIQYVHVACTRWTDMQHGNTACSCSMYMLHRHSAWRSSKMQLVHAAWTCSIGMQHGHAALACSVDMQQGTCS